MSLQTIKSQKGFTIVELLIVIVVIGILAAITIVAFNGVQNQAKTTKAQAVASDVQKKAEAYNATNSAYPTATQLTNATGVAKLSGTNAVGTAAPTAENGQTTVQYVACGTTGARINYWDYTTGAPTSHTGAEAKSLTVGTC